MNWSLHVLLVMLVLFSVPTIGMGVVGQSVEDDDFARMTGDASLAATEPVASPDLELPERLDFGPRERVGNGSETPALSIAPVLANDAERFDARYRIRHLEMRLTAANSDSERRVILRETRDEYSAAIVELRNHQKEVAEAYAAGLITDRELLNELAHVHSRSLAMEAALDDLERKADETPGITLGREVDVQRTDLASLKGPVRGRVAAIQKGTADPIWISMATSDSAVVLAMIENDEFNREAIRFDNWDAGAQPTVESLTEAIQRTESLYPWAFAEQPGSRSYSEASAETYSATSEFEEGSVHIHLDRSTGEVYREHQSLRVDRIDMREITTTDVDGVTLRVSATYPGGPLRIELIESDDGQQLDGNVTIDGRRIGSTGEDGTLWMVAPHRGSTTITAMSDGTDVTVEVHAERLT